jgi:hypothetical protein
MNSDSDSSVIDSNYLGPTSYSIPTSRLSPSNRTPKPPHGDRHRLLPDRKINLLPVEILSEIFLYVVRHWLVHRSSPKAMMLVCRRWHDVMLSIPGIHSRLEISRGTEKQVVERLGRRWLLDVAVDTGDWSDATRDDDDLDKFYTCFMTAAESAFRWRSLALVSLPPLSECKDLRIMQPLERLESFKLTASCNLGNFLEPLMTAITTTVTPRLSDMDIFHPDAALYLVQPAHLQIFSSLTNLTLICRRMQNPVDILPYLHNLKTFEAHHLFLPNYPPSVDLPLIQTLIVLRLKSVSVQWMAGQIFPGLRECSIIFPHRADAIRSVHMPDCYTLEYHSNHLGALEQFHLPNLAKLEVKCGQWEKWRGNLELAALYPIFVTQSLTHLRLQIKCSEQLLAYMLGLVPTLEELWMGLSSPHALGSTFFLAFAAGGQNTSAVIGPSSQAITPLCRKLKRLHLHYQRWFRGSERKALIPAFGDVVASHHLSRQSGFSLYLSFDESPEEQVWEVHKPVKSLDIYVEKGRVWIGFSGAHGIVPLSTASWNHYASCRHFKELEYITTQKFSSSSSYYFTPFHSPREVRAPNSALEIEPNTQLSSILPFFHRLEVLHMSFIPSSFLAGQTFHKLQRYRESSPYIVLPPGWGGLLTEMPVCTRLVVPLSRLATLKLPRVCELGLTISSNEDYHLWEKHVAVNANLSGLKVLHLCHSYHMGHPTEIEVIKILRSLPALKTLVIERGYVKFPYVNFFRAFVPRGARWTSGLYQSSGEGHESGVLCPRLESLQIEGIDLDERPGLLGVLKGIVHFRGSLHPFAYEGTVVSLLRYLPFSLGSVTGRESHSSTWSPLKSFTFYSGSYWELVGRDGKFCMQRLTRARTFTLDI